MQNQQNMQNVKTWQAPELVELGGVAQSTENGAGPSTDAAFNPTS